MNLKNKWILITGASSGFGAATAMEFATHGAKLLLGARRLDRLQRVANEARAAGALEVEVRQLDVANTASVNSFMVWAAEVMTHDTASGGKLFALINNAGGALGLEPVIEGKDEDWEAMFQSNTLGVLRMTRAALPCLKGTPGACIINVGSIAGRVAYEGGAAYCAAKAGVLQITRALRLELNGTGIRVSTVDPGMAETEFSVVRFKGDVSRAKKVYEGAEPLQAKDVADIIVWVASRPAHVNIDELIVKPTDQAAPHKVHRRPVQSPV